MPISDAISRITQIQAEIANLRAGGVPSSTSATGATSGGAAAQNNFASALAQAQATGGVAAAPGLPASAGAGTALGLSGSPMSALTGGAPISGAQLPAAAGTMLTTGQQQFASRLAADTGMSSPVICAWLLAEESSGAAKSRQAAGNNDWLNIGYTDSGTFGAADSVWSNPTGAADATAGWLKGQNTIPGYGTASSGVQGILATAGQTPQSQIAAIQGSGWASSGYPDLPSLYQQVAA
jgi:hypothetical protein